MAEPSLPPPGPPAGVPGAQRRELLESLRRGRVPGSWLYHSPGQAGRWLAYHQAWSPSRRDGEVATLYGRAFGAAVAAMGPPPGRGGMHAVGLGCGGGTKDALLLEALVAAGWSPASVHYTPLDAAPALVAEASGRVSQAVPGVTCHPLVAALQTPGVSSGLPPGFPPPEVGAGWGRLVSCLGVLPNFPPAHFAETMARWVRPGDRLVVSANLSPGGLERDAAAILPQYENPPARAWYGGALRELGFAEQDLALSVAGEPISLAIPGRDEGCWRVVVTARLLRPVVLHLFGEQVVFGAGEALQVFFSNRFTVSAVTALMAGAGLEVAQCWVGAGGEEGIFLCRPGPAGHPGGRDPVATNNH